MDDPLMDDPSQEYSREHLRQTIDAKIKSLEESIRALKYCRNDSVGIDETGASSELAPVSSIPTEAIAAIFSFSPSASCVTHVCHQWREIALNQPLLWSRVDCTNLTLAGVREILAQAKNAPLHLEARFHGSHWKRDKFSTFEKELLLHISHHMPSWH